MKQQVWGRTVLLVFAWVFTLHSVTDAEAKTKEGAGKTPMPDPSYYVIDHGAVDLNGTTVPQKWIDKAAKLDVIFNHASVGNDIMRGLEDLRKENPKRFNFVLHSGYGWKEPTVEWFKKHNGFGDAKQGRNGNPKEKIAQFEGMIRGVGVNKVGAAYEELGRVVDVGISKLGWADITDGNLNQTFQDYKNAMEGLEKKYPNAVFVWCTLAITNRGVAAHERYNQMIRSYVNGRNTDGNSQNNVFLYDVADIQSHDPSGKKSAVRGSEAMFEGYARDPGHLNELGRQRAARALYWLLARIAGWTGMP